MVFQLYFLGYLKTRTFAWDGWEKYQQSIVNLMDWEKIVWVVYGNRGCLHNLLGPCLRFTLPTHLPNCFLIIPSWLYWFKLACFTQNLFLEGFQNNLTICLNINGSICVFHVSLWIKLKKFYYIMLGLTIGTFCVFLLKISQIFK